MTQLSFQFSDLLVVEFILYAVRGLLLLYRFQDVMLNGFNTFLMSQQNRILQLVVARSKFKLHLQGDHLRYQGSQNRIINSNGTRKNNLIQILSFSEIGRASCRESV